MYMLDVLQTGTCYCLKSFGYFFGIFVVFFFNDTATTEIYTLSLHDALPIYTYHSLHKWCWSGYWILHITMCLLVLKTTSNNKILCLIPFIVAKSWSSDSLISKFRLHIACWDRSVSCAFQQEWQPVLLKTKLFKNKEKASFFKLLCRPP